MVCVRVCVCVCVCETQYSYSAKTILLTVVFYLYFRGPQVAKRVRRLEKDGKMLNVNEGR